MRLTIGSDHAGFAHKQVIAEHLRQQGHTVIDVGPQNADSVDYPDYAKAACRAIIDGAADGGVLICGSGIGIAISANKIPGIRCALIYNQDTARLAKEHNNAQVVAIGARFIPVDQAIAMVDTWLAATFEARHQRRLDKIHALEAPTC